MIRISPPVDNDLGQQAGTVVETEHFFRLAPGRASIFRPTHSDVIFFAWLVIAAGHENDDPVAIW